MILGFRVASRQFQAKQPFRRELASTASDCDRFPSRPPSHQLFSLAPPGVSMYLPGEIDGRVMALSAGVGMYGVMSYAVAQSTRELGLRMVLGASAANLLRLVISRGMRLTAGGILFGAIAALALTKLLGRLLYNVSPHDPWVFGSALAVMALTAVSACLFPAWRAARTEPARVLRDS